jgi:hypothetical protein
LKKRIIANINEIKKFMRWHRHMTLRMKVTGHAAGQR